MTYQSVRDCPLQGRFLGQHILRQFKTQHLYYLVVPCADEAYIVDFRLEKLYDDDISDMKGIEEAFLKGIKVEKNN